MSFWNLSDGESAATGEKEYEQPSGNLDPIPDGSSVMAIIDEAKWNETRDERAEHISLRWSVMEPAEYANRKIFQKLWVTDDDPNTKDADKMEKKRDKAKRMLAAIDANCGGKLARKAARPNDDDLALALTNKAMVIKCMVWEMPTAEIDTSTGKPKMKSGNWISAVSPKSKGVDVKAAKVATGGGGKSMSGTRNVIADDVDDDDIPFMTQNSVW